MEHSIKASTRLAFLGGCGQFGLNMTCVESGEDMIVVDCGAMFPNDEMPGIDWVLPDLTYLEQNKERVRGYFLTHGHEDHIGAMPFALEIAPAPVYGSPFTLALLNDKFAEYGLHDVDLRQLKHGDTIPIGDNLVVDALAVAHSIPQSYALSVDSPAGRIVFSGDFKMTGTGSACDQDTDRKSLEQMGNLGVDVLVADSTNALVPGTTASEETVLEGLEEIFVSSPGRIFVSLFSTNVARIATICELAKRFDRQVAFDGRSLQTTARIARDLGLLDLPHHLALSDIEDVNKIPRRHSVVLVTGSQAEPRSSLSRLAVQNHSTLRIEPGDTVIFSSRIIPGRNRQVDRMVDRLCRLGADVEDQRATRSVHASGHGSRQDLIDMLGLLRPRFVLPVHGRYRMQLAHAEIAGQCGVEAAPIPRNGALFELSGAALKKIGQVPSGQVLVEGKELGEVGLPVLRDRRALAHTGMVVAVLLLDPTSKTLARPPELLSRGLISSEQNRIDIMEGARREIESAIARLPHGAMAEPDEVSDTVRTELRRYFRKHFSRAPVVLCLILDL